MHVPVKVSEILWDSTADVEKEKPLEKPLAKSFHTSIIQTKSYCIKNGNREKSCAALHGLSEPLKCHY
jgi:hypothetical protein